MKTNTDRLGINIFRSSVASSPFITGILAIGRLGLGGIPVLSALPQDHSVLRHMSRLRDLVLLMWSDLPTHQLTIVGNQDT